MKPFIRPISVLALAGVLSACASISGQTRTGLPTGLTGVLAADGSATGARQTAPGQVRVDDLAGWWRGFNDPQLTALVMQALQANTGVLSAQAALLQARALRDVKVAATGPSVSASASGQRNQAHGNGSNLFQAGMDASWETDLFGANASARDAAQADAQAAQASLAAVQVSLAAEVALTYLDLRSQQARLAIARDSLAAQQETLQITRWRVQAGLATSLDQEQGVAASEQTAAQLPALQTGLLQAMHALAVLTGQSPGALTTALDAPRPLPQAPEGLAMLLPADTLRQRPDVSAAEFRIRAALARVQQADAQRLPSFRISGTLGLRALTLGALTSGGSALGSLLASVSMPVLDGGAAVAQLHAQEAALTQARLAYQTSVLTALKDVEDALVSLQGNRERLMRLTTAVTAAGNADLMARQRFEGGLIDYRVVLDAQRTLLASQDSLESTRAALSADHVRLYKALGGGWTPDPDLASAHDPAR